ncbi:MAG TPA: HAD-IA family hydrolase [Burkholderiaceae bacterium]|nr:HAD-IA family hydrolase [Burkholderiaceae bacterium]
MAPAARRASLRALIWDVDGTLAETERDGHRAAFNDAFAAMGLPWHWSVDRYGELLTTSGGLERLLRDLAGRDDAPRAACERLALARELHRRKNAAYVRRIGGGAIALRPGVRRLMQQAREAGARLAIATTTGRANVDALLAPHLGAAWHEGFAAIVCAEQAPLKKPHPQVYELALRGLGMPASDTLAIEDSPQGVASARAAGVAVLLARSAYFAACDGTGAIAVHDDLAAVQWPRLCELHRRAMARP